MKDVDTANKHFSNMAQAFDHPCKQTCSGWEQGFERGFHEGQEATFRKVVNWMMKNDHIHTSDCSAGECNPCVLIDAAKMLQGNKEKILRDE